MELCSAPEAAHRGTARGRQCLGQPGAAGASARTQRRACHPPRSVRAHSQPATTAAAATQPPRRRCPRTLAWGGRRSQTTASSRQQQQTTADSSRRQQQQTAAAAPPYHHRHHCTHLRLPPSEGVVARDPVGPVLGLVVDVGGGWGGPVAASRQTTAVRQTTAATARSSTGVP
jgi:hypothetical protein